MMIKRAIIDIAFILGISCVVTSIYWGAYLGEYDRAVYILILGIWGMESAKGYIRRYL